MKSLTTFIGLAIFGIIAVIIGAAELTTNQFAFIVFAGFLIYACVIVTRDYLNHVYDIRHNRDIDTNFWALIPNFNLNWSGSFSLEFEFLCFAWYIDFVRKEKKEQPFKFNVSNGPFNSIYDLTESIKKFGKMDIRDHVIVPPPESCIPSFDIMSDDPAKIIDEEKVKSYLGDVIKNATKGEWIRVRAQVESKFQIFDAYVYNNGQEFTYGFSHTGAWTDGYCLGNVTSDDIVRAISIDETQELLVVEASRRGYKKGVKIKRMTLFNSYITNESCRYDKDLNWFFMGGLSIFICGEWQEIEK